MLRRQRKERDTNPNLIPVMDVTFLFIFFLLMSAQFIEVSQVVSDAPTIKTTDSQSDEKPLNLTLIIDKDNLTVLKGLEGTTVKRLGRSKEFNELTELHATLMDIKSSAPTERSIIVRPAAEIPYEDVIRILDAVREVKPKTDEKLFDLVVFET